MITPNSVCKPPLFIFRQPDVKKMKTQLRRDIGALCDAARRNRQSPEVIPVRCERNLNGGLHDDIIAYAIRRTVSFVAPLAYAHPILFNFALFKSE